MLRKTHSWLLRMLAQNYWTLLIWIQTLYSSFSSDTKTSKNNFIRQDSCQVTWQMRKSLKTSIVQEIAAADISHVIKRSLSLMKWLWLFVSSRGHCGCCCVSVSKDIFDLFGLQQDGSILTRTVAVGLSHDQNQVTVGNLLHHKHPETTQTTSYTH